MAEICNISTCSIRPSTARAGNNDTHNRIELTPWDLQFLMLGCIQKGLLFFKPHAHQKQNNSHHFNFLDLIQHLKSSLSRTLDFFPTLAGRLASIKNDDNTTSFFIQCNDAGAQFTHASTTATNLTVRDILEPIYVPPIVHHFFPSIGYRNIEGTSKPFLAVQVTELADGFFIGFTMNHSIVDGTSFWYFINSWSEISLGFTHISKSPVLKHWSPSPNDFNYCPIRIPHEQLIEINDSKVRPPVQERVFHFSKENVRKLKAKANTEMGTETISSLQALLAHLWRSVLRSRRNVDLDQETNLWLLVGARPRLRSQLPEGYFGNAVHPGVIKSTVGELLKHGLGWAALQINEMVALQTYEQLIKFYESWAKTPKVVLINLRDAPSNSIFTSSSPWFNVYGNDFGWGKPVAVRSGTANKADGKITIFAGVEEGSIDIEVCLAPETLHVLGDDQEFMQAVS